MKKIGKSKVWFLFSAAVFAAIAFTAFWITNRADANRTAELRVAQDNDEFILSADTLGTFYRTTRQISDARLINLPETGGQVAVWNESAGSNTKSPHYAISLDGKTVSTIKETSYEMLLRYGKFDPLAAVPATTENLTARTGTSSDGVFIVQFVTQPLDEYQAAIKALGGEIFIPLPNHAYIVKMNADTKQTVANLPFVRWVGNYQPAYKIEEFILDGLTNRTLETARYNIMVLQRGATMQNRLANKIRGFGGKIEFTIPEGFRIEATLTPEQVVAAANEADVLFIDRWTPPEQDMDIVRTVGGANFIENTTGFKGQGVRAEVMDAGFLQTHTDFTSGLAPILHQTNTIGVDSHGTATYGINFGRGTTNAQGRGMLPEAQGIMATYGNLTFNRYTHTAELKQDPYKAVYQSNSWGGGLTTAYTTISAEMDDILFINDFCLLNSQSNAGSRQSRPQAWSKNVVSIGGISHQNTASLTDDRWTSASIGPAADGRLKPELAHFYDNIYTTTSSSNTAYTSGFNGTSAATPITAGHFGIFFQMWHNGVFGNPTGATVFDSRPHMTTAKAVMINTAIQWDMTIAGTNTLRERQGFGRVDLTNLYNLRNKIFVVDETDVLTNLQTKTYTKTVPAGSTDPLKVTMVYADPMGSPSATRARINDLSLKVTAPDGTIYWGNNGLGVGGGMWSTSGGTANIVDTVENVFIQTPAAGNWTIEVIASELVADARPETTGVIDADYSLVVSGIANQPPAPRTKFDFDGDGKADVSAFRPSNGTWSIRQSQSGTLSETVFGFGTDKIVPADYDGDGKTDIAVFRDGIWYLNRSQAGFTGVQFGTSEDVPVPADYDGDNKADIAVFRPSTGTWYLLQSTSGFTGVAFGQTGDKPVPADYDGDNKADIGVFRNGIWYLQRTQLGFTGIQFGQAGDKTITSDFDGDGKADIGIFRPSNGGWYLLRSTQGYTGFTLFAGDIPVPADYDGDGKADYATFVSGAWNIYRTTAGFEVFYLGNNTDTPLPYTYIQ